MKIILCPLYFGIANFVLKFDYKTAIKTQFSVLQLANYGLECDKILKCIVFYNALTLLFRRIISKCSDVVYFFDQIHMRRLFSFLYFRKCVNMQIHPQNHIFHTVPSIKSQFFTIVI